jgi:hypothetical protein
MTRALLAALSAALLLAADPPAKISRADRAKLLKVDADRRETFAANAPDNLPERKWKLPTADAPAFDWVRVTGLTPVHAQGGHPNCVAQACAAAMEWNWQIRNGGRKPVLSPQPVLDRTGKRVLAYTEALDVLLRHGTAPLTTYPYTGEPRAVREKTATPYRIVGWGSVGPRGKLTPDVLKKALLEHGPLVAGVYVTPAFHKYKGGVFAENVKAPDDDPTNHAVVLIGWDDRRGKGSWHVQNSWGLKWGDGGGMWIEYGSNNIANFSYWLTAQSTQYDLPADAHTLLGPNATPFPTWAGGRAAK